jgi:hypothetical protein
MTDDGAEEPAWHRLPGPAGATIAVGGEVIAASSVSELSVWRGDRVLAVAARAPSPGRPRILGGSVGRPRVWWGPHVVTVESEEVDTLDELLAATTVPPRPYVGGRGDGEGRVASYAWSPDGETVLVATQDQGGSQSLAASAVLMSATGKTIKSLWQASEFAPAASWVARQFLVLGTRPSLVFDVDGNPVTDLPGASAPIRIEASADERTLLVTAHDQLARWDTGRWTATTAAGPWLDAALAPEGELVAAIGFSGELSLLDTDLHVARRIAPPGPPTGVAIGADHLVVTVAGAAYLTALSPAKVGH